MEHKIILTLLVFIMPVWADDYAWDWSRVNTDQVHFSEHFLFGVGTSSYQVDGCHMNVWDRWAQEGHVACAAGLACDHWNRYKDDVQLIKNVGANAYRFSVEWSTIEPGPGVFNEQALQHYADVCDELLANGIAPIITLHHYNDPIWFADLGGFEHDTNIFYYVRFAHKVIECLHNKVHLWLTFNSPTSYAMKGYSQGMMPPGKQDKQLAVQVIKNLLVAHVQLYHIVKAQKELAHAQIGILHNIFQLDPANWWNPLDHLGSSIGSHLSHGCLYEFFKTGVFKVYIPFLVDVYYKNSLAPESLDFIGLNYYSHGMMSWFKPQQDAERIATNNAMYTIYPEGFYRAIKELWHEVAQPLNIPIYVTENGIAPVQEEDRDLFLRRYIYAMSKAIKEGCDVRGYCYWSLMDNYEWGTLGEKRYGLYHVDFDTQERTLKPSAQYYSALAATFGKSFNV